MALLVPSNVTFGRNDLLADESDLDGTDVQALLDLARVATQQ